MAVAKFDIERHHIGLGPADGDLLGFLLSGAYQRNGQNFGSPTDFGGATDLIATPTLSRWTMDDFSGGAFTYKWGKDPAMFANSNNLVPSQADRTVRTVPPLVRYIGENTGGLSPVAAFSAKGYLYGVFAQDARGILRWNLSDKSRGQKSTSVIADAAYAPNENLIYVLLTDGSIMRYGVPDYNSPVYGAWFDATPPMPVGAAKGMELFNSQLIYNAGNTVWALPIPDDKGASAAPAQSDWARLGRLPGPWIDSVSLNGLVYILCGGPNQPTQLVAYDGNAAKDSILPVTDFPYDFQGECLCSYAGRLYVGGSAKDIAGNDSYAMLFEVTGTSLRVVKSFHSEFRARTATSRPRSIHSMAVYQGLLWFGDTGRGLIAYDITTDAFYGASLLPSPDGITQVRKIVAAGDDLFCWLRTPTIPANDGWHRIARTADGAIPHTGRLITSDFAPEPDRRKRWSQLRIMSRYGRVDAGYSLQGGQPGGDTFQVLNGEVQQQGDIYLTTYDLSDVPPSHQIRFKMDMTRSDQNGYSELLAFTASFAFLDTGKWAWSMTVNGTEYVEGPDGDAPRQDVHDIGTELRRYWRERTPLNFRDLDGSIYKVQLLSFGENQPMVGQAVGFVDDAGDRTIGQEAFYNVTLVEV